MRIPLLLAASLLASTLASPVWAFERTEERAECADRDPLRRPLFGDLHVHTLYSFDSYTSGQRNDPWDAYRYAKGEPIELPGIAGDEVVVAQLRRPLDFTAVTDHAEYLGEINTCTKDPWTLAYWMPICILTRSDRFMFQLMAAGQWVEVIANARETRERSYICGLPGSDCTEAAREFWQNIQRAAEEHYDRSAACSFTTFVGYEYTDTPDMRNMHRNVIHRNDRVTELPISAVDTGSRNVAELWRRLRAECLERDDGCDVLAIPHNSNLSKGLMFADPASEAEARDRLELEPIAELIQHKAASECRFDRVVGRGVDTTDELCSFEQNRTDTLASLGVLFGEMQSEAGRPVPLEEYARRNMLRNVLKDGLTLERETGVNPFRMGFIGSTDTHSATPGGAHEDGYVGHLGRRDVGYRNVQDHIEDNPGGLAVVWAEENSRDAIFEGMRRRETYATSGTRPTLRFFGGWEYAEDICGAADLAARGYAGGVPMGGVLGSRTGEGGPRFVVSALKDPAGVDLQRVQVVKGWVDAEGATHERVIDAAGGVNGASVDTATCAPRGAGQASLCAVWEDPDFDPAQGAFYYARVLENPTCRWSTLQCMAAGVNPFAEDCAEQAAAATAAEVENGARGDVWGKCCWSPDEQPFYENVIQERAWSSPIWYRP